MSDMHRFIRPLSLAGLAAGLMTASSAAGVTFDFSADIYGRSAGSGRLPVGTGTYTVLDLYVSNTTSDSLRLLSVFNLSIELGDGVFVHDDADADGQWSAAYSTIAGDGTIDSFVTFGAMTNDDPYTAALDPNFEGEVAGSVSTNAGWYNADPTNGQGDVDASGQVLVGRFVVANDLASATTFSISGELAYNFQSPGVHFDNDTKVFALPAAAATVPGSVGALSLIAAGLARRGRRR